MEDRHVKALKKFVRYVEYHQIEAKDIWGYDEKISVSKFLNKIEQLTGINLSVEESSSILEISSNEDQSLEIKHFQPLGIWVGQTPLIRQNGISQSRPKTSKKKVSKKITYNTQIWQENAKKSILMLQQDQSDFISEKNYQNRTTASMLQSYSRLKKNESDLQTQIMQNSLDKKWDYLLKVGQMNNWIKSQSKTRKIVTTKKIINDENEETLAIEQEEELDLFKVCGDQNEIIILHKNENGDEQVLPLKVFDQKYQSYKKKFADEEKSKNNMKGTMMMVLDDGKQRFSKTKLHQKIAQRDQELNYLLLQIIRVKNMMEQQEKILTQCGINV